MSKEQRLLKFATEGKLELLKNYFLTSNTMINLNQGDADGFTCLHVAAEQGQVDLVCFLIHHGANVNCKTNGKLNLLRLPPAVPRYAKGVTPLHVATQKRNTNVVRALQRYDANVAERDATGKTALQYALKDNNMVIARLLMPKWKFKKHVPCYVDMIVICK